MKSLDSGSKITILTNGPLTNLAKIVLSEKNLSSIIQVSGFTYLLTAFNYVLYARGLVTKITSGFPFPFILIRIMAINSCLSNKPRKSSLNLPLFVALFSYASLLRYLFGMICSTMILFIPWGCALGLF